MTPNNFRMADSEVSAHSMPEQKWWQNTVFYEVYIASFQDGNGGVLSLDSELRSVSRHWRVHVTIILIRFSNEKRSIHLSNSHEVLASRGLISGEPEWLAPFGVLITREARDVDKTFGE